MLHARSGELTRRALRKRQRTFTLRAEVEKDFTHMGRLKLIAQVALGLIFVVFGLNGFFHFIPVPSMPDRAQDFLGALVNSGYLMRIVKLIEIGAGVLLLLGLWVPLALACLAPVILNIFLFHSFLAPAGMPLAIAIAGLEAFLMWCHREQFKPLLKMKS